MGRNDFNVVKQALFNKWRMLLGVTFGFVSVYYLLILLATMVRFAEIPNYLTVHDVLHNYYLVLTGTPSLIDAIPIMFEEPWLETGYKNPLYYGVATWSYMLIPLKMLPIRSACSRRHGLRQTGWTWRTTSLFNLEMTALNTRVS